MHRIHRSVKEYRHYIGKAIIRGAEEYVRFTVRIQRNQNGVHNVFVTDVDLYEKPLLDASLANSNVGARLVEGRVSDTKLENFFKTANNSSKVIDEQGYPLKVYHGSYNSGIEYFDNAHKWSDAPENTFWFSSKRSNANYKRIAVGHLCMTDKNLRWKPDMESIKKWVEGEVLMHSLK